MKSDTIETIKAAIETLKGKGTNLTQLNISNETGLSVRTVKRHWKACEGDRVSPVPTSNDFERFKRRAAQSTMGVFKGNPDMF
jgi:hypothetical protein